MVEQIKQWWASTIARLFARRDTAIPTAAQASPIEIFSKQPAPPPKDNSKFDAMRQLLKEFDNDLDEAFRESPGEASIKALELLEKFQEEHAPEELEVTRRLKADLIARQQERAEVDALYKRAGDDNSRLINDLRQYLDAHLQSDIASAALAGALRTAGNREEAIAFCQERLERYGNDKENINIRFGTSVMIATLYIEQGKQRDAIYLLKRLLLENPDADPFMKVRAYVALAEAFETTKNFEEAKKAWKQAASFTEYKAFSKMAQERLQQLS